MEPMRAHVLGIALLGSLVVAACGGDDDSGGIDASVHDAALEPDGALPPVDAGPTVCAGALYDLCRDNSDCRSGNCRMFNDLGVMLCTESCTPGGEPCPTQDGQAVQCANNAMVCRPSMANDCELP
jgi:hypothetical protein